VRLFLAIELPDDVRNHLLVARERLETGLPKIAYTKPANLHLTLKFLGEVEKKRVDAIVESLSKISTQRMDLRAFGIDCFPARGPIRIVTAAMNGTLPPLRALVENIEQRCRISGLRSRAARLQAARHARPRAAGAVGEIPATRRRRDRRPLARTGLRAG
jgi:2'-5' RNA ligase